MYHNLTAQKLNGQVMSRDGSQVDGSKRSPSSSIGRRPRLGQIGANLCNVRLLKGVSNERILASSVRKEKPSLRSNLLVRVGKPWTDSCSSNKCLKRREVGLNLDSAHVTVGIKVLDWQDPMS